MRIDAHQHFWRLDRGDYGWLTPALSPIFRDFAPSDLKPLLKAANIEGSILVQAAPTVPETHFMLELAQKHELILGVVGWADFESSSAAEEIADLAAHPKLVGLRPMIQDIADDDWMLRHDLTPAFEALIAHDLTFDALVLPRHLSRLRALLARHPEMRTVIDHCAKPEIVAGRIESWAADMQALASETNAYCKLSGLATEAGDGFTEETLEPYVDKVKDAFGFDRLIWGSDWPVATLAIGYQEWAEMAERLAGARGDAKAALFGGNAARAYQLDV